MFNFFFDWIGMAYVAQQPWLQHGTMRENIVWGEMFDESRYRKVIWACALHKDIEDLGGDNIDIGENGSSLSGGQKARVALARAVYQEKQSMKRPLKFHIFPVINRFLAISSLPHWRRVGITRRSCEQAHREVLHIRLAEGKDTNYSLLESYPVLLF